MIKKLLWLVKHYLLTTCESEAGTWPARRYKPPTFLAWFSSFLSSNQPIATWARPKASYRLQASTSKNEYYGEKTCWKENTPLRNSTTYFLVFCICNGKFNVTFDTKRSIYYDTWGELRGGEVGQGEAPFPPARPRHIVFIHYALVSSRCSLNSLLQCGRVVLAVYFH